MPNFSHLHVHTQYSLLDGAASIEGLMQKAEADGMRAVALTDHGNMFGAFNFVDKAEKHNIKPIVGCEFYLVEDRHIKAFSKEKRDKRYHQLLLAKNQTGYHNLAKLCSLGYIEGMYSKYPRIDKELLEKYHEGLIATSCCIAACVPQAILYKSEEEAEKEFQWWLNLFGEDYYIELQRHNLQNVNNSGKSQEDVNQVLLKWAEKYNVKAIATNDSHYIDQEDSNAHDILLCVNTGEKKITPIGDGKGFRFGFPNNEFYFKTQEQMNTLFSDVPFVLDNTNEIVDKVEVPQLRRDILVPQYQLPEGFTDQNEFLKHLTFEGAKKRYAELTPEIQQRIDYELDIIRQTGFPGYFLIVQDFTTAARNLGVSVGPGRGSAVGSIVAYCIGITNVDPLKYDLLFERFLNPERVNMPDIDIDFDDVGRSKVIDYVVDKYGKNQVAQIVNYGRMKAKLAVRDVARVLDLPLSDADKLAKMIPDVSLDKIFNEDLKVLEGKLSNAEAIEQIKNLRTIFESQDSPQADVLREATVLEGSVRNTGIHASAVIIAPDDITKYVPVCTSKDSDLLVTQFDGKVVESAGMLKMDFLGLKTLSIIKDTVALIKQTQNIDLDMDEIPLDDTKTYELYQRGDTNGTFQFESAGMQKHLRHLKPEKMEDLIAMNALYRPGPMQFIDSFINRKIGKEEIEYPHPLLEGILKDTYGIMVYQEQIMQTAQIIAGYTLGGADLLRRAMGKKKMDIMQQQKEVFIKGAAEINNIDKKKSAEIFDIMIKFAEYGFNHSHSAAYSMVAYQTAYLKANYPAEFMASTLTHNMQNLEKVTFYMEECRRMGVSVLGPDVNESDYFFNVNKKGKVRFGLGAVKGVGEGAVEKIVEERKNGDYKDIFDLTSRIDLRAANKKTLEGLALAGAFDNFENAHRAQYFHKLSENAQSGIEMAIKFGAHSQEMQNSSQTSLFGEAEEVQLTAPQLPECERWSELEKLAKEKEVVGIFISGHPLDVYKREIKYFCNASCEDLKNSKALLGKKLCFGGIVIAARTGISKRGNQYGILKIEDFNDSFEIPLFGEKFTSFRNYLVKDLFIYVQGTFKEDKYKKEIIRFELESIGLLSDMMEKKCSEMLIRIPFDQVSESMVDDLDNLLESNPGTQKVCFNLVENGNNKVNLISSQNKIKISNELIDRMEEIGLEEMVLK